MSTKPPKIAAITADTDWAETATLLEAHERVGALGQPISYFVTQEYPLDELRHSVPVEFGPHPNLAGHVDPTEELARCSQWAPEPRIFRGHSLHWTERLRAPMRDQGYSVSSSAMQYLAPNIRPYRLGPGLVELPIFWMDMVHLEYTELTGRPSLTTEGLGLDNPGLKVLIMHPVHTVLNTRSRQHYMDNRHLYHDADGLRAARSQERGVYDLFEDIVKALLADGYEFRLLTDVVAAYEPLFPPED